MTRRLWVVTAVTLAIATAPIVDRPALASTGPIEEFPIPNAMAGCLDCFPKFGADIVVGADGGLWITEFYAVPGQGRGRISRMATDGTVTAQFLLPDQLHADRIAAGPDGALWFTEPSDVIGRITTSGELTTYRLPDYRSLGDIAAGPDGALWFTERNYGIGRIGVDGQVEEYKTDGSPYRITQGPDGAMWFTWPDTAWGSRGGRIGRITVEGKVTSFPVPCNGCDHNVFQMSDIAAGPDGALWFTEDGGDYGQQRIGRMTPDGVLSEFPVTGRRPAGIAAGPDGAMWFTESGRAEGDDGRIGRVSMAGEVREYQLPTSRSWPLGITAGPDGNLWLVEYHAARVAMSPTDPTAPLPPPTPVPSVTALGAVGFLGVVGAVFVVGQATSTRRARRRHLVSD